MGQPGTGPSKSRNRNVNELISDRAQLRARSDDDDPKHVVSSWVGVDSSFGTNMTKSCFFTFFIICYGNVINI